MADDAVIAELLAQLLERLQSEVLYVHCRGGHGRTGDLAAPGASAWVGGWDVVPRGVGI